jgi:hypothetical protein
MRRPWPTGGAVAPQKIYIFVHLLVIIKNNNSNNILML